MGEKEVKTAREIAKRIADYMFANEFKNGQSICMTALCMNVMSWSRVAGIPPTIFNEIVDGMKDEYKGIYESEDI